MSRTLPLLLALALPTSALAADFEVAVIQAANEEGTYAEVADQLEDSTEYDISATLVDVTSVSSSADLASYEVVVIGSSGQNDYSSYSEAFRTAMSDYATGGGNVVASSWASYESDALAMDWMPIDQTSRDRRYCTGPTTVTPSSGSHPIMEGISTFTDTTTYWETPGPALVGAEVIATGCGGQPAVTVLEADSTHGRLVYAGAVYFGISSSYKNEVLRSGPADQLLEQAVVWAAGGCQDDDEDGVTTCGGDCDDADPTRFPGNTEACDGIDNDCDAIVPDDELDGDADGQSSCEGDCDDADPDRFDGNPEVCDEIDNDCNDAVDDGLPTADWWPDSDEDGFGDESASAVNTCGQPDGYVQNDLDCDDLAPEVNPDATEIPDNLVDEDCDGTAQTSDEEDDTDDGDGTPVEGGCACSSASDATPAGALLLAVPLIWMLRRRR